MSTPRRDACNPEMVIVDEDYTVDDCDVQICVEADATITLPTSASHGQRVEVIGDGGDASVTGGAFPLVGQPVAVADGSATWFTFACSDRWVPECCTPQAPPG